MRLADCGWCIQDNFLEGPQLLRLMRESRLLWQQGALRRAGIGGGNSAQVLDDVRRDHVHWIDPALPTLAQRGWLHTLEQLRLTLNKLLYLGLFDYEGHLAVYPPRAFYRRHLDSFRGQNLRRVSVILYLNQDWQTADGGQLRLYPDDTSAPLDIDPMAGRLVIFLSERFEHEVLPTGRQRMSLAGWYRNRGA